MVKSQGNFDILRTGTAGDAAVSLAFFVSDEVSPFNPVWRKRIMQNPKAIATLYRGVLYRSRLEARWSVFFNHLGLNYSYEPEGYELPSGWYLPDFFIRDWDTFVEVKPERSLLPDEVVKGFELQQETGKKIIILVGEPYPKKHVGLMYPSDCLTIGGQFAKCNHCDKGIALVSKGACYPLLDNGCFNVRSKYILTPYLADAYRTAMSARFGEGTANG
jgi:hypothetical protein